MVVDSKLILRIYVKRVFLTKSFILKIVSDFTQKFLKYSGEQSKLILL